MFAPSQSTEITKMFGKPHPFCHQSVITCCQQTHCFLLFLITVDVLARFLCENLKLSDAGLDCGCSVVFQQAKNLEKTNLLK